MISLEEALSCYASTVRPLGIESIPVLHAVGRVLASDVLSLASLPRFDQSAMDGFAVRVDDLIQASREMPVRLRVGGTSSPGIQLVSLAPGCAAIRILTGARLPEGADAVIPQEVVGRLSDEIEIYECPMRYANVRKAGEEIGAGAVIGRAGQRVTPGMLASFINAGILTVVARKRPRVQVITTGDELRPTGTSLEIGEVPDSNGPMTAAMLAEWGYTDVSVAHVVDDAAAVRDAIACGLQECDLTLTTGGASVGDRDYVVSTAEGLGVERAFWKVAQKPGKPLYFGTKVRTDGGVSLLVGMPGNPAAVLCCLLVHVRTVLHLLEGDMSTGARWRRGVLAEPVNADRRRARLMRMIVDESAAGGAKLAPLPLQDSHMMSNLSQASALVVVPASSDGYLPGHILCWTELL